MKKLLFIVILCFTFTTVLLADSGVILQVVVDGLGNVRQKAVLSAISLKKGKIYSAEAAKEDVRSILELGFFDNVEVRFDATTGILTYEVSEKPYIETINFKGNKEFSKGKLKGQSTLKEKDYYDLSKFEETKLKILTYYRDRGFADCNIEVYPTVDSETNKMTITFLITEGNKITIGGTDIEGVISFKKKKVLKLMKTKYKKVFKEETYQTDLRSIEAFYKNNGFMDYKFVTSSMTYNEERTQMYITLNISEGVKYHMGEISYGGNEAISEKQIKKIIKVKKGDVFDQSKIYESMQGIYEAYSNKGYLHSVIEPVFNKGDEEGIVNVNLSIMENSLVYVGNIYIDGLISTKEKVIRREILVKEGQVLSAGKVRRSMEKIYNLGFIEAAEPQILPTGSSDIMDLVFSITEGKPGMITAGAGYSSVDYFVGSVQFQHMNLFGLGQRLNLMWEFGARRQNYEIDWTDPWILNKNASLTLSAYNIERKRDYAKTTDAYKESRVGASMRIGPRISDYIGLLFGYTYEHVRIFEIDNSVKQDIEAATDLSRDRTSSIMAQAVYDSRDYIFDASKGNRQVANVQFAGGPLGGNVNFIKGTIRSSWFFPTFWKFVLSFNLNAGYISAYGGHDTVPIYEKFYIGGADTVRGYKYRTEIGPYDGGIFMTVANIEYKFPIVAEKGRTILQGAFFYDIGGTWEKMEDINFSVGTGQNNLRSGVGFGIRFATPVFPLRLDWGYGLNHKEGETLQQFYFTIGNVF
ncbi:MAG: outer membrane protein assembly factor BamA [Endomicrobium sp.]|jgi:outer membrane protein insertion porin family|nr:outer membrane protein assembly factor BamA [Endomicrobium sp.]